MALLAASLALLLWAVIGTRLRPLAAALSRTAATSSTSTTPSDSTSTNSSGRHSTPPSSPLLPTGRDRRRPAFAQSLTAKAHKRSMAEDLITQVRSSEEDDVNLSNEFARGASPASSGYDTKNDDSKVTHNCCWRWFGCCAPKAPPPAPTAVVPPSGASNPISSVAPPGSGPTTLPPAVPVARTSVADKAPAKSSTTSTPTSNGVNGTQSSSTVPEMSANGVKYLLPPLLPEEKGKKTLVLDLDETLVHSSFKPIPDPDFVISIELDGVVHRVYVRKRPGVDNFLRAVGEKYEVVVFTASLAKYADPLLDILDRSKSVKVRLFREACVQHYGNYVKDLTHLGRILEHTIIIDNSPFSYMFQPDNAIPISSWFSDKNDRQLYDLLPFLESLLPVEDVSTVLTRHRLTFNPPA